MPSSCLVKLFVLFGFLVNAFSRSKRALPSSIYLDSLKSLLFNIEYSKFYLRKYLLIELCIAAKEDGSLFLPSFLLISAKRCCRILSKVSAADTSVFMGWSLFYAH